MKISPQYTKTLEKRNANESRDAAVHQPYHLVEGADLMLNLWCRVPGQPQQANEVEDAKEAEAKRHKGMKVRVLCNRGHQKDQEETTKAQEFTPSVGNPCCDQSQLKQCPHE